MLADLPVKRSSFLKLAIDQRLSLSFITLH